MKGTLKSAIPVIVTQGVVPVMPWAHSAEPHTHKPPQIKLCTLFLYEGMYSYQHTLTRVKKDRVHHTDINLCPITKSHRTYPRELRNEYFYSPCHYVLNSMIIFHSFIYVCKNVNLLNVIFQIYHIVKPCFGFFSGINTPEHPSKRSGSLCDTREHVPNELTSYCQRNTQRQK